MVKYDRTIIYTFAERLYRSAQQTIATFTISGVLIGGGASVAVVQSIGGSAGVTVVHGVVGFSGAFIVGGLGYLIGSQRAFQLKLQAQIALCQVKIEENTRTP